MHGNPETPQCPDGADGTVVERVVPDPDKENRDARVHGHPSDADGASGSASVAT
ncbi:hypothetical protein GCM10010517_48670 [Streptosporangium fragile]|uniref:Uncharacterized protein n=1 Tax=Streptosporangium fragile TaxID=46186 RepID=A0ABN3W3E7_9ACTN